MTARSKMLAMVGICSLLACMSFADNSSRTGGLHRKGLPVTFQQNSGQAPSTVRFIARENAYNLFLNRNESVLQFFPTSSSNGAVLRTTLLGSKQDSNVTGEEKQPGIVNYLNPKDPKRNITGIPTFAKVRYREVYKGVDLVYYGGARKLEYDFEVAPGADPASIQMEIAGADSLAIDPQGNLIIKVGNRKISWLKPAAYQEAGATRREVASSYQLLGHTRIAFTMGEYDRSKRLIIDPTLVYSTYFGGSTGATSEDTDPDAGADAFGAVAVDSSGNAYVLGITTSFDYPTTPGAYDPGPQLLGCDPNGACPHGPVVTKLSSGSGTPVYSTYIQFTDDYFGTGGIAVDSRNRAMIAYSAADPSGPGCGCTTGVVRVLNATGSALDYSMFLGGELDTDLRDIAVDSSGNAYVVGKSDDPNLPNTANAFQPALHGGFDAIVAKLDPSKTGSDSVLYMSYFGGSQDDDGTGIATSGGQVYFTGSSLSGDFPVSFNAFQRGGFANKGAAGDRKAFVAKLNTNAAGSSSFVYSTFLSSSGDDAGKAITIDTSGNTYVTGSTNGTDFPTTTGAYRGQITPNGTADCSIFNPGGVAQCTDVFVTKVNSTGTGLVFSTYVGGEDRDVGERIRIDANRSVFLVGNTDSAHFPTTPDALRASAPGGPGNSDSKICGAFGLETDCRYKDGLLLRMNSTGSALLYSTYIGGSQNEAALGLALTPSPSAVVAGGTDSNNFPTSSNAWQKTLRGPADGFVMKLSFPATSTTTCSAPSTSRTIHICSPTNGSTVSSPVKISATAKPGSSAIQVMQVYVDGVKKYEKTSTNTISTSLSMSAGAHRVTVQAKDSAGYFRSTVNITVH